MIVKIEGTLTAITPIHHGGNEKTGSTPVLRTIMMYDQLSGEMIPMPYINGNAIRGKCRRQLMLDFVTQLDLTPDDLPVKLYHVLFAGGLLESTDESASVIDLQLRRRVRQLLPPISLLGGTLGNQMIQGKIKIGHAFPICREYAPYLPERYRGSERAQKTVREYTDEAFDTRRDDLRADREKDEQAIQMRVEFECFVPGTMFYHWIAIEYPQGVEINCLSRLIELWRQTPVIGGKSSSGYGQVRIDYHPELPSSADYLQYIRDNRDEIVELIQELGGAL